MPGSLANLVYTPDDITRTTISHLCQVLKVHRDGHEVSRWGAPDTLEGNLKYLILNEHLTVTNGILQLLLVGVSVACSEGIAETYGSVMESYHNHFVNVGPAKDDIRLQKEMFIRINRPPIGDCDSFCRRIASRLKIRPTSSYQQLTPALRQFKSS